MSAVLKEQNEPGYYFLFYGLDTFFHTINIVSFYIKRCIIDLYTNVL